MPGTITGEPPTKPKDDPREVPKVDPTVPTVYGEGYQPPSPEEEQPPFSAIGYVNPDAFESLS